MVVAVSPYTAGLVCHDRWAETCFGDLPCEPAGLLYVSSCQNGFCGLARCVCASNQCPFLCDAVTGSRSVGPILRIDIGGTTSLHPLRLLRDLPLSRSL